MIVRRLSDSFEDQFCFLFFIHDYNLSTKSKTTNRRERKRKKKSQLKWNKHETSLRRNPYSTLKVSIFLLKNLFKLRVSFLVWWNWRKDYADKFVPSVLNKKLGKKFKWKKKMFSGYEYTQWKHICANISIKNILNSVNEKRKMIKGKRQWIKNIQRRFYNVSNQYNTVHARVH